MERKASPTSVTTAVATAEESTNFPIGGYTLVCCGEQLLCFGGWIPGVPAKPPAARPQTAPAGRTGSSGGAQRASNALHAFHLGEKRWRELAADTAVMPPPRAGHACVATGPTSLLVLGGTGSSHRKMDDVWELQLQRTETSFSLQIEMRVEAWTAARAKAEREAVAEAAAAKRAEEAAAAAAGAEKGKKGGSPPAKGKKGEEAPVAEAPKPVLLVSNVLSALSAALGLPPECFGLELLEDEAAAVEGEVVAADAPPDGVSMRLCVLPLRGVGLKRYGVDGDLLPNKAMAALHELLLDAAPVAPVEEEAKGKGPAKGKGGKDEPQAAEAAAEMRARRGKQVALVGYPLLAWRQLREEQSSVAACVEWRAPAIIAADAAASEAAPAAAKGGKDAKKGGTLSASPSGAELPRPAPEARCGHTATPTRAGVLVFGGSGAKGVLGDLWQLHLAPEKRWERPATQGAPPPARAYHSAVVRGALPAAAAAEEGEEGGGGDAAAQPQQLVLYGGQDGKQRLDALSVLYLPELVWSSPNCSGPAPAPRCWPGASAVPGAPWRMLVFGGMDSKGRVCDDAWSLRALGEIQVPALEAAPKGGKEAKKPPPKKGAAPAAEAVPEAPPLEPAQFAWVKLPAGAPTAFSALAGSSSTQRLVLATVVHTAPRCVELGGGAAAAHRGGGGGGGALLFDGALPPRPHRRWSAADLARAEPPTVAEDEGGAEGGAEVSAKGGAGGGEGAPAQLLLRRVEVEGVGAALRAEDVPYVVVRQGGEELCRADARLDSSAIHLSTTLRAPLLVPPTGGGAAMRLPEVDDPDDRPLEIELWRRSHAVEDAPLATLPLGLLLAGQSGSVDKAPLRTVGAGGGSAPAGGGLAAVRDQRAATPAAAQARPPLGAGAARPATTPLPGSRAARLTAAALSLEFEFVTGAAAAAAAVAPPEVLSLQAKAGDEHMGTFVDGKLEGRGTCTYATGARYDGEWVGGLRHGYGELHEVDGAIYRGDWADGMQAGVGTWSYPDGSSYSGPLKRGKRHGGRGTYTSAAYNLLPPEDPLYDPEDTVRDTYDGGWVEGKREGQGVQAQAGGLRSYEGGWHLDQRSGHGVSLERESWAAPAERYVGEWSNDVRHGRGALELVNGEVYSGQWRSGQRNGHGELTGALGECYSGKWIGGVRCGTGHYEAGAGEAAVRETYDGQWAASVRHGQGRCSYVNGDVYVGQWKSGRRDGDGCLGSDGGTATYEGRWSDDERHGHGKQVSADGDVYSGQWHANQRSGRGHLLSVDGGSYEGMWAEGKRNGTGTLKTPDGDEYDGEWVDDVRSGVGRHVNKHGEEYKGQWKDGERCGRGRCLYARQPDFKPPPPGFTSVAVSAPPPTLAPAPRPKMLGASPGGAGPGSPGRGLARASPPQRHLSGNLSGALGGSLNDVYEGQWVGGKRHGEGRFAGAKPPFGSGDVYTGQWADDERHGHGRCEYGDGAVYEGSWFKGKPHGEGALALVPAPPESPV